MICRICHNREDNRPCQAREMLLGLRETFLYFQCARCGCLQIAEPPKALARYYPGGAYSAPPAPRSSAWLRPLRALRDRHEVLGRGTLLGRALARLVPNAPLRRQVERHFPGEGVALLELQPRSRILDVGCGDGGFLQLLGAAGFTGLLGIDAFLGDDIERPGGPRLLRRELHQVPGEWDLIMLHHSLEHMPDQLGVLRRAAELLRPGGFCLVRVPLVGWAWEAYGADWVQLDAPRHLYLHSERSLRLVAEAAGLRVVRVVYDSTALQLAGSEQCRRDIPLSSERSYLQCRHRSIFSETDLRRFEARALALNAEGRGDQAAFYLQRPPRAQGDRRPRPAADRGQAPAVSAV